MMKLLWILTCISIVATAEKCEKEKFEYYHYQSTDGCLKCDKCIKGEGRDPTKVVPYIPGKGATACSPCEPCPVGSFNKKEAMQCRLCRNCSALNMEEIRPCTREMNAKCSQRPPRVTNSSPGPNTTTQFGGKTQKGEQIQKEVVVGETVTHQDFVGVFLIPGMFVAASAVFLSIFIIKYIRKKIAAGASPEQGRVNNYGSRSSNNSDQTRDSFLAPVPDDTNITSTAPFLTITGSTADEVVIDIEQTFVKKHVGTGDIDQKISSTNNSNQTLVKENVNTKEIDQRSDKIPESTKDLPCYPHVGKESNTFATSTLSSEQHPVIPPMVSSPSKLHENENGNKCNDDVVFTDAKPISIGDNLAEEHGSCRNRDERKHCDSLNNSSDSLHQDLDLNLVYWSRKLAPQKRFRDFGLNGGISETDLSIIEANHPNDVQEQSYRTLIKWKHQNGRSATTKQFYRILTNISY